MLIFFKDCPNMVVRPSRIKSMLASRACRKSVMIGTPLSKKEMQRIVFQMENVEYPWVTDFQLNIYLSMILRKIFFLDMSTWKTNNETPF